ncbi:MAG: hypothetical protein E3J86_08435 [Candidatus Thorarchaeota archaeon]|nr:MAG: hypothetical protein E3J86_08435 [Candidatus Thorarchaeota archaeon]
MQQLFGIPISYFVLILEVIVLIVLVVGWIYGARRKDFNLHHKAVYFVALIHMLTVGIWMVPRALNRLTRMLANPIMNWYQIVHDIVGILAIGLGVLLVVIFLVRSGMPIKLLKQTRPLMFLTIGTWIIAFVLGVYWFLLAWVLI